MSAFSNRFYGLIVFWLTCFSFTAAAQSNTAATHPAASPSARSGESRQNSSTLRDSMVLIRGVLTDREEKSRMDNVRVFFFRREKRLVVGVLANEKGEFSRKIAPGSYDIEAQFTGKAGLKLENYAFVAGGSYYLRIEMGATESKVVIERRK
jgi:hypothetical protein